MVWWCPLVLVSFGWCSDKGEKDVSHFLSLSFQLKINPLASYPQNEKKCVEKKEFASWAPFLWDGSRAVKKRVWLWCCCCLGMKTEQTREALLRDQEKRSPFYATFDYKFSHRRWWHFMLLLLLLNWQDFNALTRTTKVRAPKSLQNLVSWSMKNWKTLWKIPLYKKVLGLISLMKTSVQ